MSTQPKPKLTIDEYLEIERKAEFRSEFYAGEMFAMSGASDPHNGISLDLALALRSRLRERGCRVYHVDMRVAVNQAGLYTYPDVTVVCGDRRFRDSHVDTLENPTFIAEVLSPSTEAYDRGRKFASYRTIPSLREYLLLAQDRVEVELYRRSSDGIWTYAAFSGMDATVGLQSLDCEIPLAEIYRYVELAPSPPEPDPRIRT